MYKFYCQVKSYFEELLAETGTGEPLQSEVLFAGIKVQQFYEYF